MKKILAAFAACIAVLSLSACNGGSSGQPTYPTPAPNNSTRSSQSSTTSVSAPTSTSTSSSKSSSGPSSQPKPDGKEFTFNNRKGTYNGDWENGAPNGIGTFTANDGTVISGKWENGKISGKATMNFATGETAKVEFENNRLIIRVFTYTDKDGTKITLDGLIGEDGGLVGEGKITYNYKDGTSRVEDGFWGKDDRKFISGTITTTYKDGSSEEIIVQDSMEDGGIRYISRGSLIIKSKDGTTVRYSGHWNANGHMVDRGLCRIDKPDGTWSVVDGFWKDGKIDNGTYEIIDSNGKLKQRGKIKNGKYSGDWEKLFGSFLQGFGQGLGENGHPFWGAAVEGIGDIVGNHGSLN